MPIAASKRLSRRPTVSTNRRDAQRPPHPPQPDRKPRRRSASPLMLGSLEPPPDTVSVLAVAGSELLLEIALLALDDSPVHCQQHARQKKKRPEGTHEQGQPGVSQRQADIGRVAG